MTAEDAILDADLYSDEDLEEADIVEWYEARPVTLPAAESTGAIVGACALGVLTAVELEAYPLGDVVQVWRTSSPS